MTASHRHTSRAHGTSWAMRSARAARVFGCSGARGAASVTVVSIVRPVVRMTRQVDGPFAFSGRALTNLGVMSAASAGSVFTLTVRQRGRMGGTGGHRTFVERQPMYQASERVGPRPWR